MQTSGHDENDMNSAIVGRSNMADSQVKRKTRFQACVACRATKTKCLPSRLSGSCQACLRSNRPCVMPGPPKPRMKSAQKFSELEKRIEMLTNALAGKELNTEQSTEAPLLPNAGNLQTPAASSSYSSPDDRMANHVAHSVASTAPTLGFEKGPGTTIPNVVQEGLMGEGFAAVLYQHWNTHIRCYMPIVFLNPDIDARTLQASHPILFLAILTISSTSLCPSFTPDLVTRLTHVLSQQIFVQNTQSIDLVLATLLFSQYYFHPEVSSNLAPDRFVYAATALSYDLGLHVKAKALLAGNLGLSMDAAQACLGVWYTASITASHLHRQTIVHHSLDLEEYAAVIEREQPSLPRWHFSLLKLQQILEGVTRLLNTAENKSESAFDEPSTQYKMNMFQRQVDSWEAHVPDDLDERLKQHALHSAYLRIHEIAIRCFIRKIVISKQTPHGDQNRHEDSMMGLTPLHFDCLTKCFQSVKGIFESYLALEILLARCLPNIYFSWNVAAAVLIIKLAHFIEELEKMNQQPSKIGGSVLQMQSQTTVTYYLDAIVAKMEQVSNGEHCPQAKAYIAVLKKLKPYYLQKRSICINPRGDAIVVDNEDEGMPFTGQDNREMYARQQRGDAAAANVQSSLNTISQKSSDTQSQQQSVNSLGDNVLTNTQGQSTNSSIDAAYDPLTYAETDWNALTLDQSMMDQLDSFMWDEEDNAWMFPPF